MSCGGDAVFIHSLCINCQTEMLFPAQRPDFCVKIPGFHEKLKNISGFVWNIPPGCAIITKIICNILQEEDQS